MKMMSCRYFEEHLEEYASGTLPDFERQAMGEHAARCAWCAESLAQVSSVVSAARRDPLALPGDAYFDDLLVRLEDGMEADGLLETPRRTAIRGRPARLFSPAQTSALATACFAFLLWAQVGLALLAPWNLAESRAAGLTARETAPAALDVPTLQESVQERNRKIEEIYRKTDFS